MRLRKKLLRLGMNGALFCTSLVLSLAVAEVAIRLVAPQQLILIRPDIWTPRDTLGWGHRADVDVLVNTGERTVRMRTDVNGFRISATGRPATSPRILLLGDSFMAAMQVEYEQSLAGLVEQCIPGASVWNTGVGGWDPPQYLIQARQALDLTEFDLVLVSVFLGNDVVGGPIATIPPRQPVRRAEFRIPTSLATAELVDALLAPVNDAMETRSQLFIFMKTRASGLLMRAGLSAVDIPSELRRDEADSERWRATADILSEIATLADDRHIPALFMLIPAVQQVDPNVLARHLSAFRIAPSLLDMDQPDRLVSRELDQKGLAFVSTTQPLRDALSQGTQPFGRIDTHLSPDGHRIVWQAVSNSVHDALGIERRSRGGGDVQCSGS